MPISDHSFVVYIDESGDDGLGNFRQAGRSGGSSHWLTIGCCILQKQNDLMMVRWRDDIMSAFPTRKRFDLHFSDLRHEERVFACERVSELPLRIIAVMSNKATIVSHPRPDLFEPKNSLYWYLCRYLIERVSKYCARRRRTVSDGNGKAKIIFSRRGGMNYGDFQEYLRRLKGKQYFEGEDSSVDIYWPAIDIEAVEALDAKRRAGLQIADVPTAAFHCAVEPNFLGGYEPRYAQTLAPRVLASPDGWYLGHGVKPVPKLSLMPVAAGQRAIFDFYREKGRAGPRPLYHRHS
jgi:hypothetical protein